VTALEEAPVLIELRCSCCGWIVNAAMGGTNGTTAERARRELSGVLRWSADGSLCGYCRSAGATTTRGGGHGACEAAPGAPARSPVTPAAASTYRPLAAVSEGV
jgi:hypothetical protein